MPDFKSSSLRISFTRLIYSTVFCVVGLGSISVSANTEGEILKAPAIDAVNSFAKPDLVSPKNLELKSNNGQVKFTLAPQSVTVISVKSR